MAAITKEREWNVVEAEHESSSAVSIKFQVFDDGDVAIRERWNGHDEIWSDGITIVIPKRIWAEAADWLATQ